MGQPVHQENPTLGVGQGWGGHRGRDWARTMVR